LEDLGDNHLATAEVTIVGVLPHVTDEGRRLGS